MIRASLGFIRRRLTPNVFGRGRWVAPVLLLLLTGCAEYWARPGATPAQLARARQTCEGRAGAAHPPVLQQVMTNPGYFVPPTTHCGPHRGHVHCHTDGGYFVPPSYAIFDANDSERRAAFRNCMFADGWLLAEDKEEAAKITNSPPLRDANRPGR